MLTPFFALAAVSPTRQRAFRTLLIAHLLLLLSGVALLKYVGTWGPPILGHVMLITGIVEGALLIGWRMTQLPKSLALEFLLVSDVRPWQIFSAELFVGLTRLAFLTLSAAPVLVLLVVDGALQPLDLPVLLVMAFTWGCVAGLGLIQWAYEPLTVRRWGQRVALALVVLYLLVGVLAGEHLAVWLGFLPDEARRWFLFAFRCLHLYSPFAVVQYAMTVAPVQALGMVLTLQGVAVAAIVTLSVRSAWRFQGHFHDLHYLPAVDRSRGHQAAIGDTPLRWWAIKRVSQYAGWVNLWLAGGFGLLYATFILAGPAWPTWLGRTVFEMIDNAGGVPSMTTVLVLLAAVPAAFQYGLWDSNAHERLKKLELLLLTRLTASDYWQAACAAAWKRGKGYFLVAVVLWLAALGAGRISIVQLLTAASAGVALWGLYFALGFRAFSRGHQAGGLGMALTIGLPLAAAALLEMRQPFLATLIPPGSVFLSTSGRVSSPGMLGPFLAGLAALAITHFALRHCDRELRQWYDLNHGARVME